MNTSPTALRVVLASASPRRQALLKTLLPEFDIRVADIDETVHDGELPDEYVQRMAQQKARKVAGEIGGDVLVLGADTSVIVDGRILGKPETYPDLAQMLGMLSGRQHQVMTAITARCGNREETRLSVTEVFFRRLDSAEIRAYWDSGEPVDKAGGYAIQGLAAAFVERIEGSHSGVVGLPLFETAELLTQFGVHWLHPPA